MTGLTMPRPQRRLRLPAGALLSLGLFGSVGVALALTNPSFSDYEEHAGIQLVELASAEFCAPGQMPMLFQLVLRDCPGVIASQQPMLSTLAGRFSTRWNFGLASVYRLSMGGQQLLPGVQLPAVDVLTLGVAGQLVPLRVSTSDGEWKS